MSWKQIKDQATLAIHRKDISFDAVQPFALADINQTLSVQENEAVTTLTLAASAVSAVYAQSLPADYARVRAVFATQQELIPTDIQGLIARGEGAAGYFAVSGKSLYAGVSGSVSLVYSRLYTPLVADSDQSDLTEIYSQVLLYALLKHAAHQIQDFDAEQAHKAEYDFHCGMANSNYALATLTAGAEVRTGYGRVTN